MELRARERGTGTAPDGDIVLMLSSVDQLVKPGPPSPFPRQRLQREAEEFILEQAMARRNGLRLSIGLPALDSTIAQQVTDAVREHFAVRRKEEQQKLADVRRLGWKTLIIGVAFLVATILLVEVMKRSHPQGSLLSIIEWGLTVLAWVALWKPGELLLYDWIPYRRDARLFGQLERADIVFNDAD